MVFRRIIKLYSVFCIQKHLPSYKSFSYHLIQLLSNYTKMRYANLYNWKILRIFAPERCVTMMK